MKVVIYRNAWNEHKYIEVHYSKCGHFTVRQYMYWGMTGVKNFTGDGKLHRWRKANLVELLHDYRWWKTEEVA